MCRWLAYTGALVYLEDFLFEPENSLIEQSLHARKGATTTNGDGFGIGWYDEQDTPGLYRDILPAWNDPNLKSLAQHIRSKMFLAHVRASTGASTTRYNSHPFQYGKWLFMHNGQIPDFDKIHRKLDIQIPDELYPCKLGNTDSEIIFLMLVNNGLENDVYAAVLKTIQDVENAMKEAGIIEPFKFSACISDGKDLYAPRYSTDSKPPTVFYCEKESRTVIASEPLVMDEENWSIVPSGTMLVIKEGVHDFVSITTA